MITEEMRAAGWRECPTDEVRKAWEEKGGEWQRRVLAGTLTTDKITVAYRPVKSTTWDYCPDGWGDAVKIERWLTEEDIETHGNLWRWHSKEWSVNSNKSELSMAYVEDGEVKICADNEAGWESRLFAPADYFTPARAG